MLETFAREPPYRLTIADISVYHNYIILLIYATLTMIGSDMFSWELGIVIPYHTRMTRHTYNKIHAIHIVLTPEKYIFCESLRIVHYEDIFIN